MQSERTLDLFFFQEYKWFRNKISLQAYGLNGYLLTSVNEWPAREHEGVRDKKRESSSSSSEKQGLRWNMLSSPVTHTNTHAQQSASNFTVQGILFLVQLHSLIYTANALSSSCVRACVRVEVGCRCGLAEVVDGNVLSRSHEELQLLNKTGSAMTALDVCLSSSEFSFFLCPSQLSVEIIATLKCSAFPDASVFECLSKCVSGCVCW